MQLAHIVNGQKVSEYAAGRGRVTLSTGDTVSPPVAGYVNGPDRLVPIERVTAAPGPYQSVTVNEALDGDVWRVTEAAVDFTLEQAKAKATADMAAKRYEVEVGGIELNGMPVATDRDTQAKLIAVRILAKEDAAYTVRWKGPAGFVTMDAATIIAVADAVSAHVQAAFDREAEVVALIDAATTVDEVKAIEW